MTSQEISALQARAKQLAAGWSVDPDVVFAAMVDSGGAIVGGQDVQVRALDTPYYHRVNYGAGLTAYNFFNEASSAGVTNLGNGRFEAQTVFALENIGIELVTGYDRAGTAGSTAVPAFNGGSVITAAAANEVKRIVMSLASFSLTRANELLYSVPAVDMLPYGGGLDAALSIGVATAASVHTTNGAPFAGNKRPLGRGRLLLAGGDQISAQIALPAAMAFASNVNAHWILALYGRVYRKK